MGVEAQSFASTTFTLLPGSIAGAAFPGSDGGDIAGSFPVALSDATARAFVIGAPDGKFLTLSIAAVPEPETCAPTLAGLGVVGWMARRRRTT